MPAKLHLVDLVENLLFCACMAVTIQLELHLHERTEIVANVAVASYFLAGFLDFS